MEQRFLTTPIRRRRNTKATRVVLVNMPWAAAVRPSIQCGLLKSILTRHGHSVDVHYLNAEMAAEMGAQTYNTLVEKRRNESLLGEWLFSVAAFGDDAPQDLEAFRMDVRNLDQACTEIGFDLELLGKLRSTIIPKLVDYWADSIDWSGYSTSRIHLDVRADGRVPCPGKTHQGQTPRHQDDLWRRQLRRRDGWRTGHPI